MAQLSVIGLCGSLRKGSYNGALLRASSDLMPDGTALSLHSLADVPLYNGDLDNDADRPASVEALKAALAAADAVLLVSPEYNHSVSGVLKNAIDWASRPAFRSPFAGKPVGFMTAAPGIAGGVRSQQHLKDILLGMACQPYPHPGVAVGHCKGKFDEQLRLIDEGTRDFVEDYLRRFCAWAGRVQHAWE